MKIPPVISGVAIAACVAIAFVLSHVAYLPDPVVEDPAPWVIPDSENGDHDPRSVGALKPDDRPFHDYPERDELRARLRGKSSEVVFEKLGPPDERYDRSWYYARRIFRSDESPEIGAHGVILFYKNGTVKDIVP